MLAGCCTIDTVRDSLLLNQSQPMLQQTYNHQAPARVAHILWLFCRLPMLSNIQHTVNHDTDYILQANLNWLWRLTPKPSRLQKLLSIHRQNWHCYITIGAQQKQSWVKHLRSVIRHRALARTWCDRLVGTAHILRRSFRMHRAWHSGLPSSAARLIASNSIAN